MSDKEGSIYFQYIKAKVGEEYWVPSKFPSKLRSSIENLFESTYTIKFTDRYNPHHASNTIIIAQTNNSTLNEDQLYISLSKPNSHSQVLRPISTATKNRIHITPSPILMIGQDNFINLEEQESIDPSYKFFDSSIWHRYVSIGELAHMTDKEILKQFKANLKSPLTDLIQCIQYRLYESIISQEYLEFQTRKLQNSYIMDIEDGHAKNVNPYHFHSESQMKQMAKELEKQLAPFKWNMLLIDDYSTRNIRKRHKENIGINKRDLLLNIIRDEPNNTAHAPFNIVDIDGLGSDQKEESYLATAITKITKRENNQPKYDLILLDYFLGENKKGKKEYGYKLIEDIIQTEGELIVGRQESFITRHTPFDKCWIFPITSFDNAFYSHLKNINENKLNQYFVLNNSCDPVNEPFFFRFKLFSFLIKQMNTVTIPLDDLFLSNFSKAFDQNTFNNNELPNLFKSTLYPTITKKLARFYYLKTLSENKESRFAESYFAEYDSQDKKHPLRLVTNIYLHLQHLVYLIAYEHKQEWPRMYQELKLVKRLIQKANIEHLKANDDFFNRISNYLESIKE